MLRRILIAGGYLAATLFIVVGTIVLVAYGSGYRYDFKNGGLVQRGLLLLESKPSGATISLNGNPLDETTPYRKSLEGGGYTYTLAKEGYRTWTKQLDVIPSRVTTAQYVLLMPQRFQIKEVSTYPAIQQFTASRDRSRIAYTVPSGPDAGVWVMNTRNQDAQRVYQPAVDPVGTPQESFEIMSWSDDASRLLIKRTNAAGVAPFMVNANGSGTVVDLNALFQTDVGAIRFSKSDSSQLLWSSPEGLRRIDIDDRSVSQPLARGVMAYVDAGSRIMYVSNATPTPSLWQVDRGGQKQQLAAALPLSATYDITYATYIGSPQVAVSAPDAKQVLLFADINKTEIRPTVITANASASLFNGDGRFLLMMGSDGAATYDQELHRLHQLSTAATPMTGLSWFDTYHLQYVQDGKAVIAEYDGNYATGITKVANLAPFNTPDDKSLYVVAPTSAGLMQIRVIEIRR